jgi:hypothetical protein
MHPMLSLVPSEPPRPGEAAPVAPAALTLAQRLDEANRQLALTRSLLAEKQRECNELASALAQDAHSDALTGPSTGASSTTRAPPRSRAACATRRRWR